MAGISGLTLNISIFLNDAKVQLMLPAFFAVQETLPIEIGAP